jgi:hypothetical protein
MITTFESLLEGLVQAKVDLILVGGLAVCLNGFVRLTEDLDILVDSAPENVDRLLERLKTFGEGSGATLELADFSHEPGALRVSEDFVLDIFVMMNGKTYADLLPHTADFQLTSEISIRYLTTRGLIETKGGSVRDKDQFDLIVLKRSPQDRAPDNFRLDSVRPEDPDGGPPSA